MLDYVRALLMSNASVDHEDNFGATPLMEIIHRAQPYFEDADLPRLRNLIFVGELLVSVGCDVNRISRKMNPNRCFHIRTPLMEAVDLNVNTFVRFLIHFGADPGLSRECIVMDNLTQEFQF